MANITLEISFLKNSESVNWVSLPLIYSWIDTSGVMRDGMEEDDGAIWRILVNKYVVGIRLNYLERGNHASEVQSLSVLVVVFVSVPNKTGIGTNILVVGWRWLARFLGDTRAYPR